MTKRTLDHSGKDVPRRRPRRTKEQIEMIELERRWQDAAGYEMPLNIKCMSLDWIRKAVIRTENNELVFVPAEPVSAAGKDAESIMEWDGRGQS